MLDKNERESKPINNFTWISKTQLKILFNLYHKNPFFSEKWIEKKILTQFMECPGNSVK